MSPTREWSSRMNMALRIGQISRNLPMSSGATVPSTASRAPSRRSSRVTSQRFGQCCVRTVNSYARSKRRHDATLLHYVAANGVEGVRQKTPQNAVEVAKLLLDAGAEADAVADMYEAKCTTMSMLVSSSHPAEAGLQVALAETLLDYGATLDGPGSKWQSALMTALAFGYLTTAETLAKRGAALDIIAAVAGLGRLEDTARLLPDADSQSRHIALALAGQHGHADIVRLLLDAGEDPSRYNPDGFHPHSTPLHQAVWSNHADVVRLLVERGARLDVRDTVYQGTPLDWAIYGGRTASVEYLRDRGAPTT